MEYTEDQLISGLRKADAAGDIPAAKRFAQLIQDGRQKESAPVDFSLKEMVSNIPGSAMQYGKDIISAVSSPIETSKAIGNLVQSGSNKLGRKAAEYWSGQKMEPDMPGRSEASADAVGGAIKDRYGSVDAIKNTIMNDPVGALLDVSGAGMSTKIPKIARVAAAAEPLNVATKTARTIGKAVIPKDAASKLYQSAAKFSTTLAPAKRDSIIQTVLENGLMPTSKGLTKVQGRIDALNTQLDDFIDVATQRGVEIPVNAIFQHLNELRKTRGGVRLGNESDLTAIDKIAGSFNRSMKGRKTVSPEELQFFKTEAYKDINWDAKRMSGTPIKEETYKNMARGAKDSIASEIPEASDINRLLGDLYEAQPHLIRSANRIDNRNMISINTPMNVGAGGIIGDVLGSGGAGLAAGAVTTILGNPKMKARLAIALNKLKDGDVGWLQANIGMTEVRVALALAGRTREQASDQPTN